MLITLSAKIGFELHEADGKFTETDDFPDRVLSCTVVGTAETHDKLIEMGF